MRRASRRWLPAPGLLAVVAGAVLAACAPAGGTAAAPPAAVEAPEAAPATQAVSEPAAAPELPAELPPEFTTAAAWAHLQRQVAFGPRPAGSPALADTRAYLRDTLEAAGIAVREQPFTADTPLGPIDMVNLIATLPGRRPERIAIASHYDTKRFDEFRFVGASDGASSTAVLLEIGRVLQQRDREFTIELIFFDGEEATRRDWAGTDHTYGSQHYVDAARQDGSLDGLVALVLLDMVGDRNLGFRRETMSTPWLTDRVWAAGLRLGYGRQFLAQSAVIEDDHVPFLEAGVPATDVIDLDYPAWHTAADDLGQVSPTSLEITGRTIIEALPDIEAYLIAN